MKNKPSKLLSFLFPSFADLIFITVFIGVLLTGRVMMNLDGDLGFHLTLGNYILTEKTIPLADQFSNSLAGQPVTQHEWLSGVIFALVYRILGFPGIIILSAILIATTFWFLFKQVQAENRLLSTSIFVIVLAMPITKVHWLPRPHLFTFLIFPIWLSILFKMQEGKLKLWWILPAIMLLWTNLHGAFLIGLIAWVIVALATLWDTLLAQKSNGPHLNKRFWLFFILGGATSFLATLINPSGFGLWEKVVSHIGNRYLADVTLEFRSPDFHIANFWPSLIMIGLLLFSIAKSKKDINTGRLLQVIVWLILGLYGARNLPFFAVVAVPVIVQCLDDIIINLSDRLDFFKKFISKDDHFKKLGGQFKGYLYPILLIFLTVLIYSGNLWSKMGLQEYDFDPAEFPVDAVNWLEDHPQDGKMFNYYSWGGYILYRMWPEERVFIDGKADFYGEDFVRQYASVMSVDSGWENVLDQYDLKWAILPIQQKSVLALQNDLGWKVIYQDETSVILREY